ARRCCPRRWRTWRAPAPSPASTSGGCGPRCVRVTRRGRAGSSWWPPTRTRSTAWCASSAPTRGRTSCRASRASTSSARSSQGGYGRGELNPASDIDLLFLYPWKVNPYVETVAEVILYALWDAGLQVGNALRNIRECERLSGRDLKVKTALLDARYLAGDEELYAEFDRRMLEEVWGQNPTRFFKEKLAENADRHARSGDSVYLLQPQLKDGQGGLRDLHTALWMAKVRFKV